jgi:hypothetical protein
MLFTRILTFFSLRLAGDTKADFGGVRGQKALKVP